MPAQAEKVTSYDVVPYIGYSFKQTHPDRLATAAKLFGMSPAPIENCRVLEIACGDGGNLIPMADALPNSRFVGFDLAGQAVARGQAVVDELGLKNIELRQMDLMDVGTELGEFDYIIAHGVYSWIPAPVRDKMIELCRSLLAPQGVAYVSYNTFPGWHLWRVGRDIMRFHTRDMSDPEERITQGMTLLKFLQLNFQGDERKYDLIGYVMREHLDKMQQYHHHEHIFHDDLADINDPVYFYQFAQHAAQHGLQFLAEAELFEMQSHGYPEPIRQMLAQFPTNQVVLKEQYLDFLKGRAFRQTLLCRAERKLNRELNAQQLADFYLSSLTKASSANPDLRPGAVESFEGSKGGQLQTDFPLAKAALIELQKAQPRPMKLDEIIVKAQQRLAEAGIVEDQSQEAASERASVLTEILLAACKSGLARVRMSAPFLTTEISEKPVAYHLARYQAQQSEMVTNVLHDRIEIDNPVGLELLRLLDGTRNRAALIEALTKYADEQKLFSPADSENALSYSQIHEKIEKEIEPSLNKLARMGLLIA